MVYYTVQDIGTGAIIGHNGALLSTIVGKCNLTLSRRNSQQTYD